VLTPSLTTEEEELIYGSNYDRRTDTGMKEEEAEKAWKLEVSAGRSFSHQDPGSGTAPAALQRGTAPT
jgi:hypothetical protein